MPKVLLFVAMCMAIHSNAQAPHSNKAALQSTEKCYNPGAANLRAIEQFIRKLQQADPHPAQTPPVKLAPIVLKLSEAYGLPWRLIVAVMAAESRFVASRVSRTHDYGLMQLNRRTAQAHGLSSEDEMRGPLGLQAAVSTLKYMERRYAHKEPKWVCRYNVGTRPIVGPLVSICNNYAKNIAKYQAL